MPSAQPLAPSYTSDLPHKRSCLGASALFAPSTGTFFPSRLPPLVNPGLVICSGSVSSLGKVAMAPGFQAGLGIH